MALTAFKKGMTGTIYSTLSDGKITSTFEQLRSIAIRYAAPDITDPDKSGHITFSHGFVNPLDITQEYNADVQSAYGSFSVFGYRFDRRSIPSDQFEREFARERRAALNENPGVPLTQSRLDAIGTFLKNKLMPAMPVRQKPVLIVSNIHDDLIGIFGASAKEEEAIVNFLSAGTEPIVLTPLSVIDYAELFGQRGVDDALSDTREHLCKDYEAPDDMSGLSELITWVWHISEIRPGKDGEDPVITGRDKKSQLTAKMSADSLVIGRFDRDGKQEDKITSAETSHHHIRYAMWSDQRMATKAEFALFDGNSEQAVKVVLDAAKPSSITVKMTNQFNAKAITGKVKVPRKFCNEKVTTDKVLSDAFEKWSSDIAANKEASIVDCVGGIFGAVHALSILADHYVVARSSTERWKVTATQIREWLEGYVPECERGTRKLEENVVMQ